MKKIIILIAILLTFSNSFAQNFTVSGYIKDKETGEELLGGLVRILNSNIATSTNQYGFYSLTIPKGKYSLIYSFLGYESDTVSIDVEKNITFNEQLTKYDNNIDKVIVSAKGNDANVKNNSIGAINMNIAETSKMPVLFGEQDILKSLQLMPGVSATSEGSSGFYVRGGDAYQNMIYLDEAPVYNASHLLGFFSVFNSDALNDVVMYKGGIPSKFGGRLSSVTDIRMKNGNMNKWNANGGLGLISSRLTLEGPIIKQKASILASFRRTYADLIVKNIKADYKNLVLYFYDFNVKTNFVLSQNDRIFVSGYIGRDDFGYQNFGFSWGNKTATARWNHVFNNKIFLNTTAIYSDYDYSFNFDFSGNQAKFGAGIYDYSAKQDLTWFANSKNTISFGWQSMYHSFKPMSFKTISQNPDDTLTAFKDTSLMPQYALESAIYISNEQKIGDFIKFEYGLRFSIFNNVGPITYKTYDSINVPIDTFAIAKNKIYNTYFFFEPRFNATIILNDQSSIKAAYNRTTQYLQLLSRSTSSTPLDMWIPSSPNIKPQYGDQVSVGYFRNFNNNTFEFSTEIFYKNLYNQVEYENGAQIYFNPDVESLILQGIGRAYGMELLLRKKVGDFTGWIAYTLLKSERKFADINNNDWFPARQDRRHDFSIVLNYELLKKFTFSLTWVFNTGDAATFPTGKYIIDGQPINLFTLRNGDRMPDYHRLDFGFTWIIKDSHKFYSDFNISLYNVYNRKNAYTINFVYNEDTGNTEAQRLALFGIVPSITWNFKFK